MSETVKITVIIEDKNRNHKEVNVTHDINMTVMSTLLEENLISGNFCAGRGVCKRCRIQFIDCAPIPASLDRAAFNPEELRQGYRLACMAKPRNDSIVRLDFIESREIDIVTDILDLSNSGNEKLARNALSNSESLSVSAGGCNNEIKAKISGEVADKMSDAPHISGDIDHNSQPSSAHRMDFVSRQEASHEIDLNSQRNYMAAVDLGTTTIAMQLREVETGRIIDTYCAMNPQRSYGADVLSRIQAANSGYAKAMKAGVWKVIDDGVGRFRQIKAAGKPVSICCMCIAGNTAMEHLLMGLSVEGLGKSPFTPAELGLQRFPIEKYGFPVYITPGIGAFVGGDIAAGLYHCNLLGSLMPEPDYEVCQHAAEDAGRSSLMPEPNCETAPSGAAISIDSDKGGRESGICEDESGAVLFIDLGTNGEMAIADGDRMIVTAAAAGPAFEGGASAALPGSDMIKITASLLEKGIIDATGLLAEPYFEDGVHVAISSDSAVSTSGTDSSACPIICDASAAESAGDGANAAVLSAALSGFVLTQADIRSLQMAKAAVRAGIDILCKKIAPSKVSKVCLAGGFGYYLDINAAVAIGLLPKSFRNCTQAAGNTSLAGAFDMGRDLWFGRLSEDALDGRLKRIESINLANEEGFESLYLSYLNFL